MTASPFLNRSISSEASAQYFLTSGRCCLSRLTAAPSCCSVSSYGSLIPSDGCFFERYSAASAIWIGLSGTVISPLYFGSYSADQLLGAPLTFEVFHSSVFGPHCSEMP